VRSLRIATSLFVFRAAIKWRGVDAAMRLADRLSQVPSARRRPVPVAADVVAHVQAVARRMPFRADCLPQSLTAWVTLRRVGFAPTVRLGIALADDPRAHAWVELDGIALGDPTAAGYHAFEVGQPLPRAIVGADR
jgi:hypothetical protein